ncbi:MAG TPA: gephyrin-like molybdotransferase Glp [Bacillota bacterium]|nr:gephyrin-like molybdotransferase Glp [Bacillota bacterium]
MKFFNVQSVSQTIEIIKEHFGPTKPPIRVRVPDALGMVLAEDIISEEQVPAFARSTVDGFAVRARDTFGATDSLPAFLDITGRIEMGKAASLPLDEGQAQYIPTGGMLPSGADGIVMIEYVEETLDLLNVFKQVAPGENIIRAGEDVEVGSVVMRAGRRLRPQDLGVLSAIGKTVVSVFPRPIVGILSTGDEIVPADKRALAPGEVRDINSMTIGSAAKQYGAEVVYAGIVGDDYEEFYNRAKQIFDQVDFLLLSGGSSVGTRDFTVQVLEALGEPGVLIHGVSIKPGKPTIVAKACDKPVMGLPGHPASALIIFDLFGIPIMEGLEGLVHRQVEQRTWARMARNLASAVGRSDYIRVKLEQRENELWAVPVFGKSGLITTMVDADGIVEIPDKKEGILEGEKVRVKLFT